jgi:integrase
LKIRVYIYQLNGKTFATLSNEYLCPFDPHVTNYITLRLQALAVNTKIAYCYELKYVLQYFQSVDIDLVQRALTGDFLNRHEMDAFINAVKFNAEVGTSNLLSIKKMSSKALNNAMNAVKMSNSLVSAHVAKRRIRRLTHFLDYMYSRYADQKIPAKVSTQYEFIKSYLKEAISLTKDFDGECVGFNEPIIPNDVFFRCLEIIRPDSLDNPFKHSKLRNYLIFSLLIRTGIRRGALAKLKVVDCKFHGSYDEITISRRPDDPSDPRRFKPSQKTKAHNSYVPYELMKELKGYIDTVRVRFTAAQEHEMIFISEMNTKGTAGEPLSLIAINAIFAKLGTAVGFHIHPHMLRHKWNEIFSEAVAKQGLSTEEAEKLRKHAMGWTRDSKMAEKYDDFKASEAVREVQRNYQDEIVAAGTGNETNE